MLPIDDGVLPDSEEYGAQARWLARIRGYRIPIPPSVVFSVADIEGILAGKTSAIKTALALLDADRPLVLRPSALRPEWSSVPTVLALGMSDVMAQSLMQRVDSDMVTGMYCDFIQSFASLVNAIDPDDFIAARDQQDGKSVPSMLARYEELTGLPFPQDRVRQVALAITSLSALWHDDAARLLRQAHGAPSDAGIALILQQMAVPAPRPQLPIYRSTWSWDDEGVLHHHISSRHGSHRSHENELVDGAVCRETLANWHRTLLHEEAESYDIDFLVREGDALLLDARLPSRSIAEEIQLALKLVKEGICTEDDALLRIEPERLTGLLHATARSTGGEMILARGIGASPGAAVGQIAFTPAIAHAMAVKGSKCILFRIETGPEDVRAMHVANGVVTGRGGMTSHAAVVARTLGVPCVAGAMNLSLDQENRLLFIKDGPCLHEGDIVTVDGTNGTILNGEVPLTKPVTGGSFDRFLGWTDAFCDIDVRANADSRDEALHAMEYGASGIGLCRTEHMFYAKGRLSVMHKMIFAPTDSHRSGVLNDLLEMQRSDFLDLFRCLKGAPICIRLFDPPLHEFLPGDEDELCEVARSLDIARERIVNRIEELREFNPMLGLRGVRLGIIAPEIYSMQARAIFEAQALAANDGIAVDPEIMIPLVSAHREVGIVRSLVEAVAEEVRRQSGLPLHYKLGVMVETPRAALRAGDLATETAFLSFGTNDLTQLTYGISRDDASRIIDEYIRNDVFPLDPFATLDREGVGELLTIACRRSRAANPAIVLSICGEHSADPATIQYCREQGFSHISCSPFNVPIARLAAAQCAIRHASPSDSA